MLLRGPAKILMDLPLYEKEGNDTLFCCPLTAPEETNYYSLMG